MLLTSISSNFHPQALKLQIESQMSQSPINRHPEFESIRNALMNQEISPDPDKCVQEVLREEIRLQSQHHITKEPKAFVAPTSLLPMKILLLLPQVDKKARCYECWAMDV